MNKEYIKELLGKGEYDKIYYYIYNLYSKILTDFLQGKNIEAENLTLQEKLKIVRYNFPEYIGVVKRVNDIFNNDDDKLIDVLDELIDNYLFFKRKFNINN